MTIEIVDKKLPIQTNVNLIEIEQLRRKLTCAQKKLTLREHRNSRLSSWRGKFPSDELNRPKVEKVIRHELERKLAQETLERKKLEISFKNDIQKLRMIIQRMELEKLTISQQLTQLFNQNLGYFPSQDTFSNNCKKMGDNIHQMKSHISRTAVNNPLGYAKNDVGVSSIRGRIEKEALTDVFRIQLKFAQTMEHLDKSIRHRDGLLAGEEVLHTSNSLKKCGVNESQHSSASSSIVSISDNQSSEDDVVTPDTQKKLDIDDKVRSTHKKVNTPFTKKVQFSETKDLKTPNVNRNISFGLDESNISLADESFLYLGPITESENLKDIFEESVSDNLDGSSFLREFEQFREVVKQSPCLSSRKKPQTNDETSQATIDELLELKRKAYLKIQDLSTQMTLCLSDGDKMSIEMKKKYEQELNNANADLEEINIQLNGQMRT